MVEQNELIAPHGGELVDLYIVDEAERYDLVEKAKTLVKRELTERELADLECISTGVYSPLKGFTGEEDYYSIIKNMRLKDGTVWPIPITLQVEDEFASTVNIGDEISLTWEDTNLAILKISSKYSPDKKIEAQSIYGTDESEHPGVAALYQGGSIYLGGDVQVFEDFPHKLFNEYRFTPKETRKIFAEKNWKTVVAFQTRNPIHRAHEHLQKIALEIVDGLFVNPLVGATKQDDIPHHVRMETYNVILNNETIAIPK